MASGAMKKFKTIEELIEFLKDETNIEMLDGGEITLKEWVELENSAGKFKKDYEAATKDKKSLREQKEKLDKQLAELTEQLNSVNSELAGLKEVHNGDAKETIQKLNKEKSDLIVKCNTSESKIRELEKQVSQIPDLEKQIDGYKVASNRARILDAVKKAAVQRNVPQNIIDDEDIMRIVADDFVIDEAGHVLTKGDTPQSVDNYITAKQKEKPHWQAPSAGGSGAELMKSVSEGGTVSDEQVAIANLF